MIEPPLQIHTAGAVNDTAALREVHYRGRLILPAALTDGTVGAAENISRPYRGHCRGGQETAPTEAPGKGG